MSSIDKYGDQLGLADALVAWLCFVRPEYWWYYVLVLAFGILSNFIGGLVYGMQAVLAFTVKLPW